MVSAPARLRCAANALFRRLGANPGLHVTRWLAIAAILLASLLGSQTALIGSIDEKLISARLAAAPRPATGQVVVLAIDKASLDAAGVWPWPRSLYAGIIDRLAAAGVQSIFIDVDFSTPSRPGEDAALAAALKRAGGSVLLPVFHQHARAGNDTTTEINRPIPAFLENAWPVFANVAVDGDGAVRSMALGDIFDGVRIQTAAAALAGSPDDDGSIRIDYSIEPRTVPTYSVSDLLAGQIAPAALAGKTVVVGATATELKDIFAVPVHGTLPGPVIHALSAETILQDRILKPFDQRLGAVALALVIIAGALAWRSRHVLVIITACILLVAAIESAAFVLLKEASVVFATAVPLITVALGIVLVVNERFDVVRALMAIAHLENRTTRRLMKRIVADSIDGVIAFDATLRVVEANAAARSVMGMAAEHEAGPTLERIDAIFPDIATALQTLLEDHRRDPGRPHSARIDFVRRKGADEAHYEAAITLSHADADGVRTSAGHTPLAGCVIIRDITARQVYHERLRHLADHDELTGLLNRRAFVDRLPLAPKGTCIATLDIENHDNICATFGRDVGDDVLKAVADRLRARAPQALLARLSDDIFAIALAIDDTKTLPDMADTLLGWLDEPLAVGAAGMEARARMGLCWLADVSVEQAIGAAESALDDARAVPGCRWKIYDPASALRQARYRMLETDMRTALAQGEFFLLYQPQVALTTGRLTGAEALVRWQHPSLDLVSPADFIPIAESNGLICDLGRWALETACREASAWDPELTVAVNVSPIQLDRSDIVADVMSALEKSGLAPSRLCLEITESSLLDSGDRIFDELERLRAMGIRIALDDFGTGYSSMGQLAGIPLDKLKLDQSFVRRMLDDNGVRQIVRAIIALAHALKLEVVAEGIEGEAEQTMLNDLGCEIGQGYRFGRPLKAKPFRALGA